MTHPSKDILGTLGKELEGKRIVLGLTGSVAVSQAPELARLLMRHGAEVIPVMTRGACALIQPDLMEWATGHKPIIKLTGKIEHVALAGNVPNPVDMILVAPATANTLGKIASGIDDSTVTTFVTTGWGEGIPIVLVPAMHLSMYNHPIVKENIQKLQGYGAHLLLPRLDEGKAKLPGSDEIVDRVMALFNGSNRLAGKRILITAGRTQEYIDPIRVITNPSTGKMGMALARQALVRGAQVDMVLGITTEKTPSGCSQVFSAVTAEEMEKKIRELVSSGYDAVLSVAAVGDWAPVNPAEKKIPTHGTDRLTIEFKPTPKILDRIKEWDPKTFLVAFRALHNVEDNEALDDAKARMERARADLIAYNDTGRPDQGFGTETNRLLILDKKGGKWDTGLTSKDEASAYLLDIISMDI